MCRGRKIFTFPYLALAFGLLWVTHARFGEVAVAEDKTVPGEVIMDTPTLRSLAFRWLVTGDDNGNATVEVTYRREGEKQWHKALPMLRVNREVVDRQVRPFRCGNLFAGSILYLEPNTTYEVHLKLSDPDGVEAEETITATTRPVPPVLKGDRQIHVYPDGYAGRKEVPNFPSLKSAARQARPGDVVLLHAGIYKGPIEFDVSGKEKKPIVFRSTGDGEVIIDGQGADANIIDAQGGKDYLFFEGLTIRNGRTGIKANSSNGLVVRRCKIEDVNTGIITYTYDTANWYIADNILIGRKKWYPRQSEGYGDPGINVVGTGHVVTRNRISKFGDDISIANPCKSQAEWATMLKPPQMAIDIYQNDLSEAMDDGIEADYTLHNVRVFDNRILNAHTGLSAQPVLGGPLYFIRNAVYNARIPLKLHNYPAGLVIINNTFLGTQQALESWPPAWQNATLRNNLFVGAVRYAVETGSPHPLTTLDYNGYRRTGDPAGRFIKWSADGGKTWGQYSSLQEFSKATGHEKHGVMVDYDVFIKARPPREGKTYQPKEIDLRLRPNSKAVDAGAMIPNITEGVTGKAPDLGCYELGVPLPLYGPRVAP